MPVTGIENGEKNKINDLNTGPISQRGTKEL
jgi:hypothetical protein